MAFNSDKIARMIGIDLVLVLVIGGFTTASLTLATRLETKWLVFVILSSIAMSVSFIIKEREKFFLYASVFFLAVNLDFHLWRYHSLLIRPISGIVITGIDIPIFFLYFFWITRLATNWGEGIRLFPRMSSVMFIVWMIIAAGLPRSTAPFAVKIWMLWMMFENWLIFIYVANNVNDEKTIRTIIFLFVIVVFGQSLVGMLQWASNSTLGLEIFGEIKGELTQAHAGLSTISRVGGTLGHPNALSLFFTFFVPIFVALAYAPLPGRIRFCIIMVIIASLFTDILTASRMGWLSIFMSLAMCFNWCIAKTSRHKYAASIVGSFLVIVIVMGSVGLIPPIKKRFFEDDYGAAKIRIPLAIVALNVIQSYFWLGTGLGEYTNTAIFHDTTDIAVQSLGNFPHPVHNEFLLIMAEIGVPGFFLYMTIYAFCFWDLLKLSRIKEDPILMFTAIGLFCGLAGTLACLQGGWSYILLNKRYWFFFGFIQALSQYAKIHYGKVK